MSLTCRDVIGMLADYLEESLTPDMAAALERHLADCRPCVAYLNTYKKTRELTAQVVGVPMPDELKVRLRRFLLDQLSKGAL